MDDRPSFAKVYMKMAMDMATRSTCARTNSKGELMKVGCAIISADFRQVLAVGYNGNASGLPNKCDSVEPGACGCLHGEENAVINCVAPRSQEKIVLCTHLPCKMCSKRLINVGGVKKVLYLNDYRIRDSIQLFRFVDIDIAQFDLENDKEIQP